VSLPRPCLVCGAIIASGSRCSVCRIPKRTPTSQVEPRERARRREVVQAWVEVNGWTCPGWHREPHESHDLTCTTSSLSPMVMRR